MSGGEMAGPPTGAQSQDETLEAAAARWEAVEERFSRERRRRGRRAIALRLALLAGGLALLGWGWGELDAQRQLRKILTVFAVTLIVGVEVMLEVRARRADHRAENEREALWSEHHHDLQRLRRKIAKQRHDHSP